jgi:PAS domain S-box-containing protein
MAAVQGFVLTGEGPYRERYREARRQEEEALTSLTRLIEGTELLAIRGILANISSLSFTWRINHQAVLNEEVTREEFREFLRDNQAQYQDLLRAGAGLQNAIGQEMERVRAGVERARRRRSYVTVILALVALTASAVVGVLGRRLRLLIQEAESRRQDAVLARREADALLAATGDGVFGVDLEGRCTFLNRAGAELLGYRPGDVRDRDMHSLVLHSHEDGAPNLWRDSLVRRSLERGSSEEADVVMWRKDGSSFPARMVTRPMVDGREVRGVVVTFTDMTEIRRSERALREAVRARDEVVAVVSHDLRNPLSTIQLAAELMLEVPLPEEKRKEQLSIIHRSSIRMGRLIEDLLDVARIEAGGLAVETEPQMVGPILEEVEALSQALVEERGLELVWHLDGELPPVEADRDRVLQIFSNLVGNAIRFTPSGGTITLRAALSEAEVVFSVSDTGAGIPEEDREHLFDRFWQPRRAYRKGAGLGLAIVKGIVDAHGGKVWAESESGEGSTFHFTLPVHAHD